MKSDETHSMKQNKTKQNKDNCNVKKSKTK